MQNQTTKKSSPVIRREGGLYSSSSSDTPFPRRRPRLSTKAGILALFTPRRLQLRDSAGLSPASPLCPGIRATGTFVAYILNDVCAHTITRFNSPVNQIDQMIMQREMRFISFRRSKTDPSGDLLKIGLWYNKRAEQVFPSSYYLF